MIAVCDMSTKSYIHIYIYVQLYDTYIKTCLNTQMQVYIRDSAYITSNCKLIIINKYTHIMCMKANTYY